MPTDKGRWYKQQAKTIKRRLSDKYGSGWELLSDDQRQNAESAEVLRLLLAQGMDKYQPAQEMVSGLIRSLEVRRG